MKEEEVRDERRWAMFRLTSDWVRGSLWWIGNELLKERQKEFNQRDNHVAHPGVSVADKPPEGLYDYVPMLFGTSARGYTPEKKAQCVEVKGLTRRAPDHRTYFGSIDKPGCYTPDEMLIGRHQTSRLTTKARRSVIWPNNEKPRVSPEELKRLERFCCEHRL
ncbi:MAG: hypothetical protein ACI4X9_00070 [Kiritimatiellia bacterium]